MHRFRPLSSARTRNFFKYEEAKKGQNKKFIIFSLVLLAGIGLGWVTGRYSYDLLTITGIAPRDQMLDTSTIQQTYATLKANYDGQIDDKKLLDAANAAMVQAVGDDYTVYMDSSTAKAFNDDLTGSIGSGIGVEMASRSGRLVVLRVLADNPALRAGIKPGDVIIAVDGKSVVGQGLSEVVGKIRGPTGSSVSVTVDRDGKSIDFTMTREAINNLSVDSYVKDGIGVIRIIRFDDKTGDLAREAAKKLKSQNVKGVVVDLRNNGGGYVSAAQAVAGIWLDDKVIMTERSGGVVIDTLRTGRNTILAGVKTVVLVNGSSASASEILAGALKEYGEATIVGEKTFGKGSVQKLYDLSDGAILKVTVAKWYTPNGNNINSNGISPDKIVAYSDDDFQKGIDTQLDAAISELNK